MISREKLTTPRQECCALRVPSISRLGKLHLVLWQVLGLHDLGLSKTFQKNHFDDRNYEYAWMYYPTCDLLEPFFLEFSPKNMIEVPENDCSIINDDQQTPATWVPLQRTQHRSVGKYPRCPLEPEVLCESQ